MDRIGGLDGIARMDGCMASSLFRKVSLKWVAQWFQRAHNFW